MLSCQVRCQSHQCWAVWIIIECACHVPIWYLLQVRGPASMSKAAGSASDRNTGRHQTQTINQAGQAKVKHSPAFLWGLLMSYWHACWCGWSSAFPCLVLMSFQNVHNPCSRATLPQRRLSLKWHYEASGQFSLLSLLRPFQPWMIKPISPVELCWSAALAGESSEGHPCQETAVSSRCA